MATREPAGHIAHSAGRSAAVRQATADDARELVRLRAIMLEATDGMAIEAGPWEQSAVDNARRRMAEGSMAAWVVDRPGHAGALAACAVGVIETRMGGPRNPTGTAGYIFNVCTEAAYRRRGYSRACMEALLDWFRERGVGRVELRASSDGEALYRSLGFEPMTNMRLRLR